MRVEVIAASELANDLAAAWRGLRARNSALSSPYFAVEYAALVGARRPDAFVAVIEEGGRIVAFLPFQRSYARFARPLGGPVSDYQALVSEPDVELDARELLHKAKLAVWRFDHLLASQRLFAPFHVRADRSFVMDLSQGFASYERQKRIDGSELLPSVRRKARKLAREVGPLRFEMYAGDRAVLERVFAWKTEQSVRTGSPKLFEQRWARELLERIHETRTQDFAGVLSALWAGDELVAAHMGMRSSTILHYWFPTYNRAFHRYAPGMCLLLAVAERVESEGITAIDFGKGEQRFKTQLATAEVPLAEGFVCTIPFAREAVGLAERAAQRIRSSPLVVPARVPARVARRALRWAQYH